MGLGQYVQDVVNELTEGRHALLREAAEQLRVQAYSPGKLETNSPVAMQTAASLSLVPEAAVALQALLQIKLQKIDMSALINKPEELFLSEEEWAGKGLREKRRALQQKVDTTSHKRPRLEADDAMEVEEEERSEMDTDAGVVDGASHSTTSANTNTFEMEGPEELAEVLEYVACLIAELNRHMSTGSGFKSGGDATSGRHCSATPSDVPGGDAGVDETIDGATITPTAGVAPGEDPTLRNLRLNLLALAKRAPLDTISRLPLELVPEHIRHYIPTVEASAASTVSTTPVYAPVATTATTASPASSSS